MNSGIVNRLLLVLSSAFLIAGCNQNVVIQNQDDLIPVNHDDGETGNEDIKDDTPDTPSDTDDDTPTPTPTPDDDKYPDRYLLECGYYSPGLPKNKTAYNLVTTLTNDSSTWLNTNLKEDLTNDYRYVYANSYDDGPSGSKCTPNFYSYDSSKESQYPGGIKITRPGTGVESCLFSHTGAKLEFRFGISQVNNASGSPTKGKDIAHVYFFNKDGAYLGKHIIEEGSITTSTTEIKFYLTESYTSSVAYFEFRCISNPYKSSQKYNFGLGYVNIKSFERV